MSGYDSTWTDPHPATITQAEFVRMYADRTGVSVKYILSVRDVIACDCGATYCEGWAMVPKGER